MISKLFCCAPPKVAPKKTAPATPSDEPAPTNLGNPPKPESQVKTPPKSKWDEIGCSSLKAALEDTVMLDAAWLADLAEKKGILPRCQDVPDSAKVSLAEMEAWDKDNEYTVGALIISYPWLDKNHPDPFGEQLQQLAFILKAFADEARKYPGCRVGVFWDYCSLPQKDLKGNDDRTAELIARFKRALKGINAWYGHPKTQVVLVKTPLPTGYEYTNKQPYEGRGWCYAENLMSCIVKDDFALFDTSQLQGTEIDVDGLRENGKTNRPAPMAPDVFRASLKSGVDKGDIKFTNRGDIEVVASIYERAFLDEMMSATALYYTGLGWGDEHMKTLATAFTFAHSKGALPQLKELYLGGNQIGDVGMQALAGAVSKGALASGARIFLGGNSVTETGEQVMRDAAKTRRLNVTF